jgi:hypothetical protein
MSNHFTCTSPLRTAWMGLEEAARVMLLSS